MAFGWQCRSNLVKQVPHKPTIRTAPIPAEAETPGPSHYDPPQICGGKGFSNIKRAPAYTFGHMLKPCLPPVISENATMFNVRGMYEKGGDYKIPGGLITPHIEPPSAKMKVPGPGTHYPRSKVSMKRAPVYSIRPVPKPPYQPQDSWTAPPNMYCPPIPTQRSPAYTFGYNRPTYNNMISPDPGEHNLNHRLVEKTKPSYSFGHPFRPLRDRLIPAPNTYCEKKYMVHLPSVPTPSFGIRHSPFLGDRKAHFKPSYLELRLSKI